MGSLGSGGEEEGSRCRAKADTVRSFDYSPYGALAAASGNDGFLVR